MKPIIMSAEDARGILDGRKTMFRQVMKPQPTYWDDGERLYDKGNIVGPEFYNPIRVGKDGEQYPGEEVYGIYSDNGEYGCKAPYKPGDVLYVKETWKKDDVLAHLFGNGYIYAADADYVSKSAKWKSPATMPLAAARLFLRVKDVRVERVQDIRFTDALSEGVKPDFTEYEGRLEHPVIAIANAISAQNAALVAFKKHWNARNDKRGYGWGINPFVWVISFERLE